MTTDGNKMQSELTFQTETKHLSLQDFKKALFSMHEGDFCNYHALKATFQNNREAYTAELNLLKVVDLKKMLSYTYSTKKADFIADILDGLESYFLVGKTVGYFLHGEGAETGDQAQNRVLNSVTEEDFLKWAEEKKAAIAARKKTFTNPETLEEFKSFIRVFGEAKLTPEQLSRYDALAGISHHAQKEQQQIKNVQSIGEEFTLNETKHTQKGHDLFVCSLNNRVEADVFKSLSQRAKLFGGYYSSYNKGGAIAGFTFLDKSSAEKFIGGGSNKEEVEARIEHKEQTRAEILREKGSKLVEEGEEELNRDRKANTHRRAAQAESAERKASNMIAFGKTLINIADGIEAGTINHLHKLSSITELETLKHVLNTAQYKHMREKNIRSENYERTEETALFVSIPYPVIYASNVLKHLNDCKDISGKKLASNRILSRLGSKETLTIDSWSLLEDYETVFCQTSVFWDKWSAERYKSSLAEVKRLKRLDLDTLPALRAAIREMIALTADKTPEQKAEAKLKALERSFIGKKIDGFFPTPEDLASKIVEEAEIVEGCTVLEPSAGLGHIAQAIREAHPDSKLTVIEQYNSLAEVLEAKGFNTINDDFLSHSEKYDRIVMNPPFENLQDIDHVMHAFSLLNDGGRLVAIMAGNKDGERAKIQDFRNFVESNGYMYKNDPDAFLSAFRSTGVQTITVVLNKQIR